tara:strand:+ start:358 stop:480 length:123 start_codon:yes stop_codon:yes gene_type:complete
LVGVAMTALGCRVSVEWKKKRVAQLFLLGEPDYLEYQTHY